MQCLHNGIYSNPYCQRNFIVSSADNLCNQFEPRSGLKKVRPDLGPNCLKLSLTTYSPERCFEKSI